MLDIVKQCQAIYLSGFGTTPGTKPTTNSLCKYNVLLIVFKQLVMIKIKS